MSSELYHIYHNHRHLHINPFHRYGLDISASKLCSMDGFLIPFQFASHDLYMEFYSFVRHGNYKEFDIGSIYNTTGATG